MRTELPTHRTWNFEDDRWDPALDVGDILINKKGKIGLIVSKHYVDQQSFSIKKDIFIHEWSYTIFWSGKPEEEKVYREALLLHFIKEEGWKLQAGQLNSVDV